MTGLRTSAHIAKEGLVTGGTSAKVRPVVACKGTTCQYGLLDASGLAKEIHEGFYNGYANVKLTGGATSIL